jgi:outer membrane protein TolC
MTSEKTKTLLVLVVVLAVSGCAIVRPTDPYAFVGRSGRADTSRLRDLPSPALAEKTISLPMAIEIALTNNPALAATGWDAVAAKAREDQVFGARLPRLRAVAGYAHDVNEQRLVPAGPPGSGAGTWSRDIVSGDAVLSMPLFASGQLVNRARAADLLRQAAEHRLVRSRQELVFNVSSVFLGILAQSHVVESLESSSRALQEHAARINALVVAQKVSRVDQMRIAVRLADVQQQWVREKNNLSVQRRILATLLGLEDSLSGISLQGELELRETPVVPEPEECLAVAWKERADYLGAKASLEARAREVDAARGERWPTVSLQGTYGGRWAAGPTTGTGEELEDVGRVGLAVEMPLYEGGRLSAKVREQRAGLAAAQERLRATELQIRLEVETALSGAKSSEERVAVMRKSIEQARESLRIEQEKYQLGRGTITDVLDAQAALLASESTYYRVLAEFRISVAQLQLAMGREGDEGRGENTSGR